MPALVQAIYSVACGAPSDYVGTIMTFFLTLKDLEDYHNHQGWVHPGRRAT